MTRVTIRAATPSDCDAILAAHVGAIRELCAGDYSETQLAAWAEKLNPAAYLPAIKKNVFLVAEVDGQVVGFAEFAAIRSEIVAMYVHPLHSGRGIGTQLFREIERLAGSLGLSSLHLRSSLSAITFYEQLGFIAGNRDLHRLGNGAEIPCVPMVRPAA